MAYRLLDGDLRGDAPAVVEVLVDDNVRLAVGVVGDRAVEKVSGLDSVLGRVLVVLGLPLEVPSAGK